MRYQGGKSRIAGRIVKTIQGLTTERAIWEPFCGGGAVTIALAKAGFRVYASDSHEDLILMWQAILAGDTAVCADVTEEEHRQIRKEPPSARRGFVGYAASFGGTWFGGFARGGGRNYADESRRNNREILQAGVLPSFRHADYTSTPDHVVAYLDPPYAGTTSYKSAGKFDHDAFWSWVSRRQGATFISELSCPLDLPVVWRKQHKSQNASNSPTSKGAAIIEREEKLFYKAPRNA